MIKNYTSVLWLMRKNLNTHDILKKLYLWIKISSDWIAIAASPNTKEIKWRSSHPSDDSRYSRRKTISSILSWIDSRSCQLFVTTRWKLSRLRFSGHEIRTETWKGKKNQRRSLRYGLGFLLVPVNVERLEKNWSIGGRRPSAEAKKNWVDIRLCFNCPFDLRRGYSERNPCSEKISRR